MKIKKHIEIVYTSLLPLSSMSSSSAVRMQKVLSAHYETVGISVVNNFIDLEVVVRSAPDLVFLGLKKMTVGTAGTSSFDSAWMADYFDQHGIRYTGSNAEAISLDYDKAAAKSIIASSGLKTPAHFVAEPRQFLNEESLPLSYPLFIKPLSNSGSSGVDDDSVIRNFDQFRHKVLSIKKSYQSSSLVEEYLEGREFTVAIIDAPFSGPRLIMPVEIITTKNEQGDRILGARVKKEDNEQVIGINESTLKNQLSVFAETIYQILGGRDYGRIDIRMDNQHNLHFLEANFVPAPGSRYFSGAAKITQDMDYETVLLKIIGLGLMRKVVPASVVKPLAQQKDLLPLIVV